MKMNCKIHIYLINDLFSQEIADELHNGKESADNLRYEWEDELEINVAVQRVTEHENGTYTLAGYDENNESFSYAISEMHLFEIESDGNPSTFVGGSKSIIDHCSYEHQDQTHTIRIYLKDYEPMANPVPGIFIASKSFPKSLIR
jgi:cytolysin (calcineurin-like family phosphatase)